MYPDKNPFLSIFNKMAHSRHVRYNYSCCREQEIHRRPLVVVIRYRTGPQGLVTLLQQRRLRWLGHVHRMEDGRIPKDLL